MSHAYFLTPQEGGYEVKVVSGFHIDVVAGIRTFSVTDVPEITKQRVAKEFGISEKAVVDLWHCAE